MGGFKDKMKEFGGGDLLFLSEDAECTTFIVCGLPEKIVGKFKGKESIRVGIPVVTRDGFSLFVTGLRFGRKVAKYEENFDDKAFMAIRHGEQGDIDTRYELKLIDDEQTVLTLLEIKEREFKPELVDEALDAARQAMNN